MLSVLLIQGCSSVPTESNYRYTSKTGMDNICQIYKDNPRWKGYSTKSYQKWRVPDWTMFAIIHQESRFNPKARPHNNVSSAYGFTQALNGTWRDYQKETGNRWSSRLDMEDSLDFIGWYVNKANRYAGVSKRNAFQVYLSYHEGWTGYKKASYRKKAWLKKVAKKVQQRAVMYKNQKRYCS